MKKPLLHVACSLALVTAAGVAQADTPFLEGSPTYSRTTCTTTGYVDAATGFYTGVFSGVAPRVGQVTYVHAVAISTSGCYNSDTVGFELQLPAIATLAISAANPVFCYRGHDGFSERVTSNTPNAACLPTPSASGYLGFSQIASGNSVTGPWFFEIQVPVIFTAGGNHTVSTRASSSWAFGADGGVTSVTVPVLSNSTPPPPTPASFGNYSATSNENGDAVTTSFSVQTDFQVGDVDVEWGTSTSFGNIIPPARTQLLERGYPVTATLLNTPSATTIYWRPRFSVGGQTFYGATQSLRTNTFRHPRPTPFPIPPRCRGFCPA